MGVAGSSETLVTTFLPDHTLSHIRMWYSSNNYTLLERRMLEAVWLVSHSDWKHSPRTLLNSISEDDVFSGCFHQTKGRAGYKNKKTVHREQTLLCCCTSRMWYYFNCVFTALNWIDSQAPDVCIPQKKPTRTFCVEAHENLPDPCCSTAFTKCVYINTENNYGYITLEYC
jgi:hypothetical protein